MQPLTNQIEQTIESQQQRVSPYMPLLAMALLKTYGLPFGGVLIANIVVILASEAIPGLFMGLFGSLASLAIFFAVLYFGWKYAESRWHGTALFVAYTGLSKTRRMLQSELALAQPSDAVLKSYSSDYLQAVDEFIGLMHTNHLVPEIIEMD